MKAVVQRVSRAEVRIDGQPVGRIDRGLVVFLGVAKGDGEAHLDWMSDKVLQLRIFEDSAGKMNRSALDIGAEILVVSQFTLLADLTRGRRPGFEAAAPPDEAEPIYRRFLERLRASGLTVASGRFREHMAVELVNDGPVTIILEGPRP